MSTGRRRACALLAVALAGSVLAVAPPGATQPEPEITLEVASLTDDDQPGDDDSFTFRATDLGDIPDRAISDDGRFVVFSSDAVLAPGDESSAPDPSIYLRDRLLATTTLLAESGFEPSISGDGRVVVFNSDECGTEKQDEDGFPQVIGTCYVIPGQTAAPVPFLNDMGETFIGRTSLSGDGRWAIFEIDAGPAGGDLGSFDSKGDVFVTEIGSNTYASVYSSLEGCRTNAVPRINRDGFVRAYIAPFEPPDDQCPNNEPRFLFVAAGGAAQVESFDDQGVAIQPGSYALSDEGGTIAFDNRGDAATPDDWRVFARDLAPADMPGELVSLTSGGRELAGFHPSVSGDGRYVAFFAEGSLWVRDRQSETTQRVNPIDSIAAAGGVSITPDGSRVAFDWPTALVDTDTNGRPDVYVAGVGPLKLSGFVDDGRYDPDGHDRSLEGARVELFRDGLPVGDPVATAPSGKYEFTELTPGEYTVRVTLEDSRYLRGFPELSSRPVFDVRHSNGAPEPVWIEVEVSVETDTLRDIDFSGAEEISAMAPTVLDFERERLDDMAAIFFRMQQYVQWYDENIETPELYSDAVPAPVEIYTFSTAGNLALDPDNGFYLVQDTSVHMGASLSDYEARDGAGSDRGPLAEWHEFTHHIEHVAGTGAPDLPLDLSDPCVTLTNTPGRTNHGGYSNIHTCDSLGEGLADFLPVVAWADIGPQDAGRVDRHWLGRVDLESNEWEAWTTSPTIDAGGNRGRIFREEYAVAALLWDLTDAAADRKLSTVWKGEEQHSVVYRDRVHLLPRELFDALASNDVKSVRHLWGNLYSSNDLPSELTDLSIDLDEDGTNDVTPLDVVFLMHGFYVVPVLAGGPDVDANWRYHPEGAVEGIEGVSPNRAIGRTDSWDPLAPLDDPHHRGWTNLEQRLLPPTIPGSYVEVDVVDPAGNPVRNATLDVTIERPPYSHSFSILLEDGVGDRIYLELPPPLERPLFEDEPLPACDSSLTKVTLNASNLGAPSNDQFSFDSCEYWQQILTAEDGVAVAVEFDLPRAKPRLSLRATRRRSAVVARGVLEPGQPSERVVVRLQKRTRKGWRTVQTRRTRLGAARDKDADAISETPYRVKLKRIRGKGCRVKVSWGGNTAYLPVAKTKKFRC